MLDYIGLALIIAGWVFQAVHLKKGSKELCPKFVKLYMLGVILLVVDGFMNGLTWLAILNLVALIMAGKVLYFLMKGKACCCCMEKPVVKKAKPAKKKR